MDKLECAVDALRKNPAITDEELAQKLGMLRPASARFWRLKAMEIVDRERVNELHKRREAEIEAYWNRPINRLRRWLRLV